jgi:transcriptional regulator with XRE-family HTH domain
MEEGREVGKALKEYRRQKGLSLKEVSEKTRIPLRYLRLIESCRYDRLPSTSYAQLYIRNYADFLGLSTDKFTSLFRRDLAVQYGAERTKQWKLRNRGAFYGQTLKERGELAVIKLRPVVVKWIVYFLPFFLIFLYLLRQYLIYTHPPRLDIKLSCLEKGERGVVVRVEGKADPTAVVRVENELIVLRQDGTFSTQTLLPPRAKKLKIVVEGVNGKKRTTAVPINCN